MLLWIALAFVVGLAAGAVAAWTFSRRHAPGELGEVQSRLRTATEQIADKDRQIRIAGGLESELRQTTAALDATVAHNERLIADLKAAAAKGSSELEQFRREAEAARIEAARMKTEMEKERASAQEKMALLLRAREELSSQFKVVANEVLDQKSRTFTEQNQANVAGLLNPLREKFGEFQAKVESLEKDGVAGRAELRTQIDNLRSLNERLSADAESLVTALRGSSKAQGDWGEFVLENLLQSAGLRRDYEYRVQKTMAREEGGNARLDVIIDLPDYRHLVIDSKLSLNSYTDYCNTEDEEERRQALKQHIASIRSHFKELSTRNYQNLYGLRSLDFVLMFVPIEPAYMLAIANDSKIWQEAYDKNIMLVSPSSLLCVVRTVAQIWRQERQTRNVEAIAKRGRLLYDKFRGFVTDLLEVGKKLGDAREAYDKAYEKLAKADGNLVWQAERLVRLGIRPTKALPMALVEEAVGLDTPEAAGSDDDSAAEQMELAASSDEPAAMGAK